MSGFTLHYSHFTDVIEEHGHAFPLSPGLIPIGMVSIWNFQRMQDLKFFQKESFWRSKLASKYQKHSALEKTKTIKVYFQNVEKFFLDTPYTTCIKTEAVNNYTKWRNQVDQYRRETNQVNTRKNPIIYKKSQEKFDWIECIRKLRCNKDMHIEF